MSTLPIVAVSQMIDKAGGDREGVSALRGHIAKLLVREAVQNAWDARDDDRGDQPVLFRIDGWDLDGEKLIDLRRLLPVGELSRNGFTAGIVHPSKVLSQKSVRVLVVSDRNTVGLCGPDRAGKRWKPVRHGKGLPRGQSRYANFVLNSGRSSAITGLGDGGAYGLGKMSLWMASECGTVLIHTRTTGEDGESVERFIGLVRSFDFCIGEQEYTGRHFIGRRPEKGSSFVAPLTGVQAERARSLLPVPPYTDGAGRPVDGTSIVIVAPRMTLDWELEMGRLRDAVRWQVWPKRVPGARPRTQQPDMDIQLSCNGSNVVVPEPLADPEIRPYAKTLIECVRGTKSTEGDRDFDARCLKPQKELGALKFRSAGGQDANAFHLTLTRDAFKHPSSRVPGKHVRRDVDEIDDEPAVDFEKPWGQIALIRREPLLLVRYEPIDAGSTVENDVGVYLSAADKEVEKALTNAEPPAHDDWSSGWARSASGSSKSLVTFVTVTLREIKNARLLLGRSHRAVDDDTVGEGERSVSERLSANNFGRGVGTFVMPPDPPKESGAPPLVNRGQRVGLELLRTKTRSDGSAEHLLSVTITGVPPESKKLRLTALGDARDSVGALPVGGLVGYAWKRNDGERIEGSTLDIDVSDVDGLQLIITVGRHLRFRPRVDARTI